MIQELGSFYCMYYILYIASLKVISATNPSINVFQNFLYFAKYIEKFLLYSKRGTYFCEEINILIYHFQFDFLLNMVFYIFW